MKDEYKQDIQNDNISLSEINNIPDNDAILVNQEASETQSDLEVNENPTEVKKNKKSRSMSVLSVGTIGIISTLLIGITNLINVSLNASFNDVIYQDGSIQYSLNVENLTDKETVSIYLLENGELKEIYEIKDEDGDGLVEGAIELDGNYINEQIALSPTSSIAYRLTIKGMVGLDVEREFDSYLVEINGVASIFNNVYGECFCSRDGTYHFDMDFIDDLGIFKDFEAEIKDEYNNVSKCIFTDNLHETQKIDVCNLKGTKATLTIRYVANGEKQTITIDITL